MPAQTLEEQEAQAQKEVDEVNKALDQRAERDENPTAEQENVESTDTIEVYSEVTDDGVNEVWKWRRQTEDGEVVAESSSEFSSDNYAVANASTEHPGVTVSVITSPPLREVEADGKCE